MNTIIGSGKMLLGGALRPYYIGTRQTALFCEMQKEGFDLQDYHQLFAEVGLNQYYAAKAKAANQPYTPTGRKALSPTENAQFLYSALAAGAKKEGIVVDFDVDTVADWIDAAEQSDDPEALTEAGKPLSTHYNLLAQRLERQAARPGNAPAPAMVATRGSKPAAKKATKKA